MNISISGQNASISVSTPEEALKLISMLGIKNISLSTMSDAAPSQVVKKERKSKPGVISRKSHAVNAYTREEIHMILANLHRGTTFVSKMPELLRRHTEASILGYSTLIQRNSNHLPHKIKSMISDLGPATTRKAAQPGFSTDTASPVYERMTEDHA